MVRKFAAPVIVFLATVASLCAAGAGEHPWNNKRIYYVIEDRGRLREKGFFVRHPGSYQKTPCVITEEEKFSYPDYDSQTPTRTVRIKTVTTPSGEALQRHEEVIIGDPGHETITITGGEARFIADGSFGGPTRVPAPPGVLFEVSGEWLARHRLAVGSSFAADILDRIGRRVTGETIEIVQRLAAGDAKTPSVWLAEFRSEGRPSMFVRFTSDGRLMRLESEGLIYQVVGREDYDLGRIPQLPAAPEYPAAAPDYAGASGTEGGQYQAYGSPAVPIAETVPAWDNFAWLILRAEPPTEWQNILTSSEYSQIDFTGIATNITALRNAPHVDAAAALPMGVFPDVQPYLGSAEAIPATHPAIIDTAHLAIADADTRREETNALKAISYLAGWINQNVAVQEWEGYNSSALDTLNRRAGDSAGHARLFAAMGRALGIPTRICQGMLVQTGRAVFHCWAEAWINGVWIPVDSTVSRVGLPAGYVLAERAGPIGIFGLDFAGFMRFPGLSLALVSAGRETPGGQQAELLVGDRASYAFAEGDWLANLYWGFALRLPPDWAGTAKLNSVEISSPDRRAKVKCEAMSGDYKAGKAELDANVSSLKSSLRRFKLVDSRVVSFDAEGATPALFIDFTSVEEGVTLRCRQYVLPRRQRAFRISFWAPADEFTTYAPAFDSILASFEF